jgi:hypothetical protein
MIAVMMIVLCSTHSSGSAARLRRSRAPQPPSSHKAAGKSVVWRQWRDGKLGPVVLRRVAHRGRVSRFLDRGRIRALKSMSPQQFAKLIASFAGRDGTISGPQAQRVIDALYYRYLNASNRISVSWEYNADRGLCDAVYDPDTLERRERIQLDELLRAMDAMEPFRRDDSLLLSSEATREIVLEWNRLIPSYTYDQATGKAGDEYIEVAHGGSFRFIVDTVRGIDVGYPLEDLPSSAFGTMSPPGDRRRRLELSQEHRWLSRGTKFGLQVSPLDTTEELVARRLDKTFGYAKGDVSLDSRGVLRFRIQRKHLEATRNFSYEAGLPIEHVIHMRDIRVVNLTTGEEIVAPDHATFLREVSGGR